MQIELGTNNNTKSNARASVNVKEAKENRDLGDSAVNTSCITCKFKPNCYDAIPFFIKASDIYHSAGLWNDEIYCREKLVFCHRFLKSSWEEGNELEKVAQVYLTELSKKDVAFSTIQNAHNAFFTKGEYKDAINCVNKLGKCYSDRDEDDYAERCLKIAYDATIQTFHTLATQKDAYYDYMYTALDEYIAILFKNDKIRIAIEALDTILKVIIPFEEDKSKVTHVYGFLLLAMIINEDQENVILSKAETAKSYITKNSDVRFLETIERLISCINEVREKQFKDNMIEINIVYPNIVGKKMANLFLDRQQNMRKNSNNSPDKHVVVMAETTDIDGYL